MSWIFRLRKIVDFYDIRYHIVGVVKFKHLYTLSIYYYHLHKYTIILCILGIQIWNMKMVFNFLLHLALGNVWKTIFYTILYWVTKQLSRIKKIINFHHYFFKCYPTSSAIKIKNHFHISDLDAYPSVNRESPSRKHSV